MNYGYKKHYRGKYGKNELPMDTTILTELRTSRNCVKYSLQNPVEYNTDFICTLKSVKQGSA